MAEEQDTNVIVAIPSAEDYVWKISSEQIPHMTLLYLEDLSTDPDLESIVSFLQHACDTSLNRFFMTTDHRGTLGSDDADVLFFDPNSDILAFRQQLLLNTAIRTAYNAVPQFPEFTPHLTLGYPTAPAKPDPRDYPISIVNFDRIALWTSDFSGPQFELNSQELSMSEQLDAILAHHGIKGMHWGVRRSREEIDVSTSHTPGKRVKTTGGKNLPAHTDAIAAAVSKQKAKKSTTDSLSNTELKALVERMNLEANYSRLSATRRGPGQEWINQQLKQIGSQEINARSQGRDGPATHFVKTGNEALKMAFSKR